MPIYDGGVLSRHKRQDHPEEYRAQRQKSEDTRQAKERERLALRKRKDEAVQEMDTPVVVMRPYGEGREYSTSTLSRLRSEYALSHARYPSSSVWLLYQSIQEKIAALETEAASALALAYQNGYEIPQADIDAITTVREATV